jgi:hypothetical protein
MSFFHLQRAYWRRTPKRRQGRSPSYPGGSRRLLHPLSVPPRAAVAPTQRPCAHRAEQRRCRLCSSSRPREGGREAAASADLRGGQGSTAAPPPAAVGRGRTSPAGAPTRAREDEPRVAPPPPGSAGPRASIHRDLHILRRRSRGESRSSPTCSPSSSSPKLDSWSRGRRARRGARSRSSTPAAPGSGELEAAEPRIERPSAESSPCSSRAGRGSRGREHRGGEPPPA